MDFILPQPPAVISSMKRLEEEYNILTRRRSTLLQEIEDDSERSLSLKKLRLNELKTLGSHIQKIEKFLRRYGFISDERKAHYGILEHSPCR